MSWEGWLAWSFMAALWGVAFLRIRESLRVNRASLALLQQLERQGVVRRAGPEQERAGEGKIVP